VHRLLELRLSGATAGTDETELACRCAVECGLDKAAAEHAATMVSAAIELPVMQRLVTATRLFLEVPFAYKAGSRIIEGRIDALAEEADGILLVDFKTDDVAPGTEPARTAQYAAQIRAYADAVVAATGRPVREASLVFLRTLQSISIRV
jgi:ATP-dependent helicase/nuclease subunit A